jgi:hypothetical protein
MQSAAGIYYRITRNEQDMSHNQLMKRIQTQAGQLERDSDDNIIYIYIRTHGLILLIALLTGLSNGVIRSKAVPHCTQVPCRCITALQRKTVGSAFQVKCYELGGKRLVHKVNLGLLAAPKVCARQEADIDNTADIDNNDIMARCRENR